MIRHSLSPGPRHRTPSTQKFPTGQSLALLLLLVVQGFLLYSTGTSQAGEHPVDGLLLPELSAADPGENVPVLRSRLTGFPGHGDNLSGGGAGVRFLDEERRIHGMGTRFQPFAPTAGGMALEAMHIKQVVGGTGPGQTSGQNNVWSLAANRRMLDNRLLLQGEYAVSHQIQEQAGPPARQGGAAHSLLARYQGTPSNLAGRPSRWGLEFSRAYADAGYWSLANLDHARERVVDRAAGHLGWGTLNARVSYSRANEVRPDGHPALRLDTQAAELNYQASVPAWMPGKGAWFGAMRYRLAMQRQWTGYASGGNAAADLYTESANLSAHFAPGPWWWELGHAYAATYEAGSGMLLNGNDSTSLRLHLPLGERLSLMPEISWGRLEGPSGKDQRTMVTGSLGSSATLMRKRLKARVVLLASHQYGKDTAPDTRMLGIESSLSWTLRTPRVHAPGIQLSLSGRYQQTETEGAAVQAPADYQAMARFEFSK
ncbi:MAG: hypothetical protein OQL11_13955 [Gammaproteobacteria bacterium]|nr:hypothetical protein [Gammaproteobacteria bacterium]